MNRGGKSQTDGIERKQTMGQEVENPDKDFLSITDLADMDAEFFTNAMDKFDLLTFDAF